MIVPSTISSEEPLLRAYSVPSGLDRENRPTPLVFRLRKKEKDISLCRVAYYDLRDFISLAVSRFKFRYLSQTDVAAGAVELLAGEVNSLAPNCIVLEPTPTRENPAHASIFFFLPDGRQYVQSRKTNEPTDPSILGYELALADSVRIVYDMDGNIIWKRK